MLICSQRANIDLFACVSALKSAASGIGYVSVVCFALIAQACPYDNVCLQSLQCLSVMLTLLCVGGGKGVKDGKDKKSKKKAGDEEEAEEETYYDAMKKEMGDRAARTKVHQLDNTLPSTPTPNLLCITHALSCMCYQQYQNLAGQIKQIWACFESFRAFLWANLPLVLCQAQVFAKAMQVALNPGQGAGQCVHACRLQCVSHVHQNKCTDMYELLQQVHMHVT